MWWLTRSPSSPTLEATMLLLYLGLAAAILWVGNREPAFAARHPGYAWFSLGFAAFVTAIVLLRGAAQEWHIGLVLAGLLMVWRGERIDRRGGASDGVKESQSARADV